MDKGEILASIISELEKNLGVLYTSAQEAKEYSTSDQSKAENKYDTRGLEASYLAGAQSKRVEEFRKVLFQIQQMELRNFAEGDTISVSALVEVLVNGEDNKWFFVLPASGGSMEYKGHKIQTLTLEAPLGEKLWKQSVGSVFDHNNNEYEVLSISW